MGFALRLAPGLKIRVTDRGMRTTIGPRAARFHVGAGPTRFSSGVGPLTYWTTLDDGTGRSSTGAASRSLAAASKQDQAQQLAQALDAILSLHRSSFPPAQRIVAPAPAPPDAAAIRAQHEQRALQGISIFKLQARREAKAAAELQAAAEVENVQAQNQKLLREYQAQLDDLWSRLIANDPDVVMGVLAGAFEDNDAVAAPAGVQGDEAALVVLVPPQSAVPERRPEVTPSGNLSLKKLTKRDLAAYYKLMVCGFTLATVREAFAVAPGLKHLRIVALTSPGTDAYGKPRLDALLAARFARPMLDGVQWDIVDAGTIVDDISTDLIVRFTGPSKEFAPIDLAAEPDIASVIAAVDASELTA